MLFITERWGASRGDCGQSVGGPINKGVRDGVLNMVTMLKPPHAVEPVLVTMTVIVAVPALVADGANVSVPVVLGLV